MIRERLLAVPGRLRLVALGFVAVLVACTLKILFWGGFGVLIMTPDEGDFCRSPEGIAVELRWLAINRNGTKFTNYGPAGTHPFPWRQAGRMGTLQTGPWFTEGVSVVMTDPEGHVLARKTMAAIRCPNT
ncbi:hypothetical protein [Dyella amyloliquefaciens]|uniref:hypothetical protein n=1 Tax=Dyella amyloliquefaciens TaxID=1770545 RepID=UPI00102E9877|nr:hypothetical protein [Dyella amyloliquefaciens]